MHPTVSRLRALLGTERPVPSTARGETHHAITQVKGMVRRNRKKDATPLNGILGRGLHVRRLYAAR